jgi:hypothetical protein
VQAARSKLFLRKSKMQRYSTPAKFLCALMVVLSSQSALAEGDQNPVPQAATTSPAATGSTATSAPAAVTEAAPAPAGKAQTASCAQWAATHPIEKSYLAKLERNAAEAKPKAGILYTQDKLILLLAKDPVAAKAALLHKEKLEQRDGKVDLRGVNLSGFNLAGLNLDNVDLKGAELNGANLAGASLRGANLNKAEFEDANLDYADLSFASAEKANFRKASLCETSLMSANVEDAKFVWAYMKHAKLDQAMYVPAIIYANSDGIFTHGLSVPPLP